jgi:RHS repeat-associated protein
LNRLASASTTAASSTPFSQTYSYNAIGNLTAKSDIGSYTYAATQYANPHAATTIASSTLAYDRNGNLTNYGTTTSYMWNYRNQMTTATTSIPGKQLYDDNIVPGWTNQSWNTTVTPQSTEQVYNGSNAAKAVYTAAWAGFDLNYAAGVSTSTYNTLSLAVHGGSTGGQNLYAYFINSSGNSLLPAVNIGTYIAGGIPANGWGTASIPFSALHATSTTVIKSLAIESDAATTVYYDDIKLTGTSTATSTYTYDQTGMRISDTIGTTTTRYINKYYSTTGTTTHQQIYHDEPAQGWADSSWNSTITYQSTEQNLTGTYAVKAVYNGAWAGFDLNNSAGVTTNNYNALAIAVHGGTTGGQNLYGYFLNNAGSALLPAVNIGTYITGGIPANGWAVAQIPLTALHATNTTIKGFAIESDAATTVYYDEIKLIATSSATTTRHIFAGDSLVGTIEKIGTTTTARSIQTDHLSGSNVVTDASGTLVETLDYYPYGGVRIDTKTGTYIGEKRKFIGQEYDAQTALSYLNARYYDGARGQFLSEDPVFWEVGQTRDGKAVLSNPQAQNSYSYAGNNPIISKDPSGRGAAYDFNAAWTAPIGPTGGFYYERGNEDPILYGGVAYPGSGLSGSIMYSPSGSPSEGWSGSISAYVPIIPGLPVGIGGQISPSRDPNGKLGLFAIIEAKR